LTSVVIDASVALAWCFPDQGSGYADAVLVELKGNSILVPAVWGLEVANGVLVGERSKRLRQPEIRRIMTLLENLSVVQDVQPLSEYVMNVLPLAREYGLSAYDAAYLELSVRYSVPVATLDRKLRKAGQSAGVKLFAEEPA
jgi:predicted nucleic acid-binding protein